MKGFIEMKVFYPGFGFPGNDVKQGVWLYFTGRIKKLCFFHFLRRANRLQYFFFCGKKNLFHCESFFLLPVNHITDFEEDKYQDILDESTRVS